MLDQHLTPAVKKIFVINIVVTLALIVLGALTGGGIYDLALRVFGLYPPFTLRGCIWQFLTYMFLHIQVMHLLFNMIVIWFFAPDLENRWGTRRFWRFYLTVGIGAGIVHFFISLLTGFEAGPLIGASGALYGVLLAFAAYNPNAIIFVYGVLPMKAKYFAMLMGLLTFLSTAAGSEGQVSNLTHLSGLAVAYVYLAQYHREWDIRRWQWR